MITRPERAFPIEPVAAKDTTSPMKTVKSVIIVLANEEDIRKVRSNHTAATPDSEFNRSEEG